MSLNVVFSEGLQPQNSIISILSNFYMIWKATLGDIVGTPPPPPGHPLLKMGIGPSKNWFTWGRGLPKFLLERGDKPEKGVLM